MSCVKMIFYCVMKRLFMLGALVNVKSSLLFFN